MSREDYEAISKIIEEVVGKDTLSGIKLLEGIRFYIDNKVEKIRIIKTNTSINVSKNSSISNHKEEADLAMKRYTERLRKESAKYKKRKKRTKKESCSTSS
jgi:hypothetical protein